MRLVHRVNPFIFSSGQLTECPSRGSLAVLLERHAAGGLAGPLLVVLDTSDGAAAFAPSRYRRQESQARKRVVGQPQRNDPRPLACFQANLAPQAAARGLPYTPYVGQYTTSPAQKLLADCHPDPGGALNELSISAHAFPSARPVPHHLSSSVPVSLPCPHQIAVQPRAELLYWPASDGPLPTGHDRARPRPLLGCRARPIQPAGIALAPAAGGESPARPGPMGREGWSPLLSFK